MHIFYIGNDYADGESQPVSILSSCRLTTTVAHFVIFTLKFLLLLQSFLGIFFI